MSNLEDIPDDFRPGKLEQRQADCEDLRWPLPRLLKAGWGIIEMDEFSIEVQPVRTRSRHCSR
jgi:hypothetical protein